MFHPSKLWTSSAKNPTILLAIRAQLFSFWNAGYMYCIYFLLENNIFPKMHNFENWGMSLGYSPVLIGAYSVMWHAWTNCMLVKIFDGLLNNNYQWVHVGYEMANSQQGQLDRVGYNQSHIQQARIQLIVFTVIIKFGMLLYLEIIAYFYWI